jgi:hypothetical protein
MVKTTNTPRPSWFFLFGIGIIARGKSELRA